MVVKLLIELALAKRPQATEVKLRWSSNPNPTSPNATWDPFLSLTWRLGQRSPVCSLQAHPTSCVTSFSKRSMLIWTVYTVTEAF